MEITIVTSLSNISPKFKQLTVKVPSVLIYLNVLINGKGKEKNVKNISNSENYTINRPPYN